MGGFSQLSLDSIDTPDKFTSIGEVYFSDRNTKNRTRQMSYWPVEDNQELILVASAPYDLLGGDKVLIPFSFVQVSGKWLADPIGSNLRSIFGISSYNIFILLSEVH